MLYWKILGIIHCKECLRAFTLVEDQRENRYLIRNGKIVSECPCGYEFGSWHSPKWAKRLDKEASDYFRREWEDQWELRMDSNPS